LLECGRYIERNPVRVGLVRSAEGYEYSSYHYYAEGKEDNLLTASPAYLGLSEDPKQRRRLYARHVSERRIYEEMKEQNLLCS
jgi:putative transposase